MENLQAIKYVENLQKEADSERDQRDTRQFGSPVWFSYNESWNRLVDQINIFKCKIENGEF